MIDLGAERIGHGYRVIENEDFYQKCLESKIHFEMCPHSSYLTGSIKGLNLPSKRHPILRYLLKLINNLLLKINLLGRCR